MAGIAIVARGSSIDRWLISIVIAVATVKSGGAKRRPAFSLDRPFATTAPE
jgi:hypothetical protein